MVDLSDEAFSKFTEQARKVLISAMEEAAKLNHNYIGTEHLLLGMVRSEESLAGRALAELGVGLSQVRTAVEYAIGKGDRSPYGQFSLTPRAKKVLALSVEESRRQYCHYIGTEHLLLGLVREGEGIAVGVLEKFGVSQDKVQKAIAELIRQAEQGAAQESADKIVARIREELLPTGTYKELLRRLLEDDSAIDRLIDRLRERLFPSSEPTSDDEVSSGTLAEFYIDEWGLAAHTAFCLQRNQTKPGDVLDLSRSALMNIDGIGPARADEIIAKRKPRQEKE